MRARTEGEARSGRNAPHGSAAAVRRAGDTYIIGDMGHLLTGSTSNYDGEVNVVLFGEERRGEGTPPYGNDDRVC